MKVNKIVNDDNITLEVTGRIDTATSTEFQSILLAVVPDTDLIVLDMKDVIYISSAGLRILLTGHKSMSKKGGSMVLRNVTPDVMEIFEITGFSNILSIES